MQRNSRSAERITQTPVHLLTRTVRLNIAPPGAPSGTSRNTFAGFPTLGGLGIATSLDVSVLGDPDPQGGYLLDIKTIDAAAHRCAFPILTRAYHDAFAGVTIAPATIAADLFLALSPDLPRPLASVRWRLTPHTSWEVTMTHATTPTHAILRQRFDFAAAHRLHVPGLSDAENRQMFGKCNNPAGHGHNYMIEASVRVPVASGYRLEDLETAVTRTILDPLDHKHLNEDVPAFNVGKGGVNPSVENIAKVCYDWLAPVIASSRAGTTLLSVTVWETDRTSATYPAMPTTNA